LDLSVAVISIAQMQAIIRNNPRKRRLANTGLNELVQEITSLLVKHSSDQVLVNLSDNDLTLTSLQELVALLRKRKDVPRMLALGLSLNRIQAS